MNQIAINLQDQLNSNQNLLITHQTSLRTAKEIKQKFLNMNVKILKKYRLDNNTPIYGYVYKITNLKNQKVYIGKTTNISNRASQYIRAFLNRTKNLDDRKITNAIINEGIENFVMEPIAECLNDDSLQKMEIYFIRKYKVCNEAYGYNENYSSYSISKRYVNVTYNKRLSEIHKGMKYDRNTKMKKAKFICGVKPDKSEFYICAGMKLFGDFVGKSKDIIKNATKTQSTICGYYIIKLEYEDMIK